MKKVLFIIVVCLITSLGASAQMIRTLDVKANLRSDFGFGIGTTINIVGSHFDIFPSYNYYFRSGKNAWHVDADVHYNFDIAPQFELFPLIGVSYFYCENGYIGANLGAGLTYNFAKEWALKTELKYQFVKHYDDLFFSIGFAYRF